MRTTTIPPRMPPPATAANGFPMPRVAAPTDGFPVPPPAAPRAADAFPVTPRSARAVRSPLLTAAAVRLVLAILLAAAFVLPAAAAAASADAEVAFAHGLAAYHRGDYAEAAERFAAAVEADPADETARAWLERARRRAAGEEEPAAAAPAPPATTLDRFGEVPPWEFDLRASIGDDSNPALLADGVVYAGPGGTLVDGPESDTVIAAGARLAVAPVRGGAVTVALVGEAYQAAFDTFDFLDFTRFGAAGQIAWGGDASGFLAGPLGYLRVPVANPRFGLLLQGAVTEDELDGEGYVSTTAAAASLFVREGAAGTTRLSAAYRDQDFDRDAAGVFEASGTETEAELEQTFYLGARHRYLRLAAAAGERDAGGAFDGSSVRGRAELALPLGEAWTLTLAGGVERIEFDGVESNPLFGIFPVDEAREDTLARIGAALSWSVTPRFLLTARAVYTDRDADLGPVAEQFFDFDYERTVVAVGFRWSWLGGAR